MDDPPLESADSSVDHQQLADDSQGPSPQDNLDAVNDTTGPEDHAATESPNELDADSLQAVSPPLLAHRFTLPLTLRTKNKTKTPTTALAPSS